ncbi:MAG: putative transposase YbfD/YdcC [Bradymonadia bacterium]
MGALVSIDAMGCQRVENKLHYVLDVSFGEDRYTARKKNAAANVIVIRHFALNLIRASSRDKLSVPRRRRLCDYKVEYREQLLADVAM